MKSLEQLIFALHYLLYSQVPSKILWMEIVGYIYVYISYKVISFDWSSILENQDCDLMTAENLAVCKIGRKIWACLKHRWRTISIYLYKSSLLQISQMWSQVLSVSKTIETTLCNEIVIWSTSWMNDSLKKTWTVSVVWNFVAVQNCIIFSYENSAICGNIALRIPSSRMSQQSFVSSF